MGVPRLSISAAQKLISSMKERSMASRKDDSVTSLISMLFFCSLLLHCNAFCYWPSNPEIGRPMFARASFEIEVRVNWGKGQHAEVQAGHVVSLLGRQEAAERWKCTVQRQRKGASSLERQKPTVSRR
ncbi:hypothetical protein GBAR_LOCUS2604 [Geodia barretti]|uniref:Uncharacterized protein n=1 Tax=Geodia barretti TaxID=519541 RepID=A0AA35R051_GEOBA|nr:hypothetical protein GBAR_LOCUS2604 [Geodia barretti]